MKNRCAIGGLTALLTTALCGRAEAGDAPTNAVAAAPAAGANLATQLQRLEEAFTHFRAEREQLEAQLKEKDAALRAAAAARAELEQRVRQLEAGLKEAEARIPASAPRAKEPDRTPQPAPAPPRAVPAAPAMRGAADFRAPVPYREPIVPAATDRAHRLAAARAAGAAGRWEEASELLTVLAAEGRDDEVEQGLAEALLMTGRLPAATQIIAALLHRQPDAPAVLHLAGRITAASNQLGPAIQYLQAAAKRDARNASIQKDLALVYHAAARLDDAIYTFRKVIDLNPKDGEAYFNLAALTMMTKNPQVQQARKYYENALQLGEQRDEQLEKMLRP